MLHIAVKVTDFVYITGIEWILSQILLVSRAKKECSICPTKFVSPPLCTPH